MDDQRTTIEPTIGSALNTGPTPTPGLTHIDGAGEARMVDVGGKTPTCRTARVGARVWMAPTTMELLQQQALPKGDVLAVARVAGIMAAKQTSGLVPLCHPLALTHVDIAFAVAEDEPRLDIECTTRTEDRTGVEMEALTGATVAAITIYDMCKAVDRGMVIGDVRLLEKTGGKEDYARPGEPVSAAAAGRRRRRRRHWGHRGNRSCEGRSPLGLSFDRQHQRRQG